jgi:hypothetical protein
MSSRVHLLLLVTLAGCTRGALPATLVADDSEAVFDTVVDAPLSRRVFSFANLGDAATSPLTVTLTGDRDSFVVDWDGCSGKILKPSDACQIEVTLASGVGGEFEGEVHVAGASPAAASVRLHGKVTPATLSFEPLTSDHADVPQGSAVTLGFVAHNFGGAPTGPLHITAKSLPFDGVGGNCEGVALAGGDSCTITLARATSLTTPSGSASGTLEAAAEPGGDIVRMPSLTILPNGVLTVAKTDWGAIPTFQMKEQPVVVTNNGTDTTGPLTIGIPMSQNSPYFNIHADHCSGVSLVGGASCTVVVGAELYSAGKVTAALTASASSVKPGSGLLTATGVRAHWSIWVSFTGNGVGSLYYGASVPQRSTNGSIGFSFPNGSPSSSLTVTADPGSTFAGWGGNTPCTGTGPCAPFVGGDNTDLMLTVPLTR